MLKLVSKLIVSFLFHLKGLYEKRALLLCCAILVTSAGALQADTVPNQTSIVMTLPTEKAEKLADLLIAQYQPKGNIFIRASKQLGQLIKSHPLITLGWLTAALWAYHLEMKAEADPTVRPAVRGAFDSKESLLKFIKEYWAMV